MSALLVSIPYAPFNTKRYSRPWGATITFDGATPVYAFVGRWDGEAVVIPAAPGMVVAHGKKDLRRGTGTRRQMCVVRNDGTLVDVTEAQARRHLSGTQPVEL